MIKFRTEIGIAPFPDKIDHRQRLFSIGSCFAESIAGRLRRARFSVESNPTGVLYNPLSIADALSSPEIAAMVAQADRVLITFGTAWVYELDGKVVANCGKRPASLFKRRRLSAEEIVESFSPLMETILSGRQTIFTVSPVRHLKDGFEENSLSKAILRVAIAALTDKYPDRARYFPAFEILNDDLRDYRFYGPDLAHPSAEAVEYVWEKFAAAALDEATLALLPQIESLVRATEHRPFDPEGEHYAGFCREMLARTREFAALHPEVNLDAELDFFG
jgi:hypothetical protein